LQETAGRAFIGIDEFTELCVRLGTEHDMDMVNVMVPLFQSDPIVVCDLQEDLLPPVGDGIVYDLPPVLHHQDQMIVHQIY
jgi:hypothetical protein